MVCRGPSRYFNTELLVLWTSLESVDSADLNPRVLGRVGWIGGVVYVYTCVCVCVCVFIIDS